MKVCFFGDWHKNNNYAFKALHRMRIQEGIPDRYIHLGDFGIYPETKFLKAVNHILEEQNTEMWVVPGNHENYNYLKTFPLDSRGLIQLDSNLFALPRAFKWKWAGVRFAALGGAFSVDRRYGRMGKTWWPDELIKSDEFNECLTGESIDILVSHEAPWLPGRGVGWKLSRKDERISKRQRDYIARVIVEKDVKINLHGHHHLRYTAQLRQCEVIGLSEDGKNINDNRFVIDLNGFKAKELEAKGS